MLTRLSGQELVDAQDRTSIDPTRPVLVGVGPVEAATTHALEVFPAVIWDANLFYRDMGVSVRATRAEIRKAYQEKGGPDNVRLTMIAGVLLNPERRKVYDRVPLGSFFFDDELEEAVRHRASTAASEVRAEGGEVDSDALNQHIEDLRQAPEDELPHFVNRYPWSYYLKNSECTDTERLTLWRTAILEHLWKLVDRPPRLAVGWVGQADTPFELEWVGYRMVCLIHEKLGFSENQAAYAAQLIASNT